MTLTTFLTRTSLRLPNLKLRTRALQVLMLALLSGAYSVSCYAQQSSTAISVPKYSTLDALGVNVSGNTVAPTVDTLAIGGEMGLSHSIMLQGNTFSIAYDEHGVRDKFAGRLKNTNLGKKQMSFNAYPVNDAWVLTASAMGDSVQFVELCNGKFTRDPANTCTETQKTTQSYFEAVHDKRHTLALKDGHVVWIKPDGTEVHFNDIFLNSSSTGGFYKIIYPNGFTIYVLSDITVQTNTGFQLKYNYVLDNRGVDASKSGITYNGGYPVSSSWWLVNAKSITAINNVYEYCPINQQGPCTNLANNWPTVTFDWPGGMPRTFFMGKSVFRVTNPAGAVAEFNYAAHDVNLIDFGQILPAFTKMAPRLMSIKPFGASQPTVSYTYRNPFRVVSGPVSCLNCLEAYYTDPEDPGILTNATGIAGTSGYGIFDLRDYHGKGYSGYRLAVDMDETYPSRLERVIAEDRTIVFDQFNLAGQVKDDNSGLWSKQYTYINNNVQTVTDQATGITEAGGYPASCINPMNRNRKTCNKPGWVKNNGVATDYTYHQLSGQIETVTLPANKNNKRAQTRYEYAPLQARYLSTSGVTTTGTPIYLKTAEKYCMNGNFNGTGDGNSVFTGTCELGANDEVVTRYEYDTAKNLHLKGKSVTAVNTAGVPTVKRTCYQYDIYDNLIGDTQPNANPASCN